MLMVVIGSSGLFFWTFLILCKTITCLAGGIIQFWLGSPEIAQSKTFLAMSNKINLLFGFRNGLSLSFKHQRTHREIL